MELIQVEAGIGNQEGIGVVLTYKIEWFRSNLKN